MRSRLLLGLFLVFRGSFNVLSRSIGTSRFRKHLGTVTDHREPLLPEQK